jgi:hypothetical protein
MEFRNVSGSTQELPTLDLRVPDGETFTATGDAAKSLQTNPAFDRVDKSSKTDEKE